MFCSFRKYANGLMPIKPNTFLLICPMKKYMWLSHYNLLYLCLSDSAFARHCLLLTTVSYSQILFFSRLLTTHPNGLTPIKPNEFLLIRPIKKYMWLSHRNNTFLLIFPMKKYMWLSHCNLLYLCLSDSAFAHHCLLLTTVRYSQILFLFWLLKTHPNGLTRIRPNILFLIRPIKKYKWLSHRNIL